MSEKVLKQLDWALALGLIFLWPVAWMLARLRTPQAGGIALVRPGGMGDLICLDMAVDHAVPNERPRVTFFVDARSDVWARYRSLSSIRYDQAPLRTLFRFIGCFDRVVVTEQRFGAAAAYGLLLAAGRATCFGFSTQRLRALLTSTVPYDPLAEHEVSAFARLLDHAVGRGKSLMRRPDALVRDRGVPPASDALWVCIAGRGVRSRELPAEEFASLVSFAARARPLIVTCQPSDRAYAQAVIAAVPDASLFDGNFQQLCDGLATAREVLTIDGGMVHVCSYFGVPVRALFTSGVVEKWRPLSRGSQVVLAQRDLPCRPCTRFGQVPTCRSGYACKQFSLDSLHRDPH